MKRLVNRIKNFCITERFETDKQTCIKNKWVNKICIKKDEIYYNTKYMMCFYNRKGFLISRSKATDI